MDRRSKRDMKEVVERKATEGKPGQAHHFQSSRATIGDEER